MTLALRSPLDKVAGYFGYTRVPPKVEPPSDSSQAAKDLARRTAERIRLAVANGAIRFPAWVNPLAGETRAMLEAYDAMLAEPMVLTPLLATVDSVAALDVQILPRDKKDSVQKEVAEFHRWNLDNIEGGKLGMVRMVALPGKVRGWSVTEKIWDRVADDPQWGGKWYWPRWKDKDVTKLRMHPVTNEYGDLVGITSGLQPGLEFDPADFVVYSHLKMFSNHRGRSALLAAWRDWWIKQAAVQLWGLGLEKWGSPVIVGKYADKASQQAELEAALAEAGANKWLSAPINCIVEALSAATGSGADWDAFVARCDKGMLIGIMGSHLSVMEGANKNVAGDSRTQRGTAELFQWSLAEEMGELLTRHGRELTRVNYPGVPSPRYIFGAVSEQEIAAMLANDEALQGMGVDLSIESLRERTGREGPRGDKDTLPGTKAPDPNLNPFGGEPPATKPAAATTATQPQPAGAN